MTPENRILELDAARGICILGMVAVHLVYDLTELYPVLHPEYPPIFLLLKNWGGVAFFLISGICVTLGHHHLRRGSVVLACAVLVSTVMSIMGTMPIRFGVLHCLGFCMLLWSVFKAAPLKLLCCCSVGFAALGWLFEGTTVPISYLYPLGLTAPGFESADFFPLLPNLGYFLAGAVLGRRFYPSRESLFPTFPRLSFLCFCGRHSLPIYLIHQPLLILFIELMLH